MPGPVTHTFIDHCLEEQAMRKAGMLGRGRNSHSLYSIDYCSLPREAKETIALIISGGPFPPEHLRHNGVQADGSSFGNAFGDLPSGQYLEFTVRTPGVNGRGKRRIVARKSTGQLFFTACHYERVQVTGGNPTAKAAARAAETANVDEAWQNGFYLITGLTIEQRDEIRTAIRTKY